MPSHTEPSGVMSPSTLPPRASARRLAREMGATFTLAWPIVIGQLASIGMNVVDTVLAGAHGPISLGAVAVGTAAWSLVLLCALGLQLAISPSVAQLIGAGRQTEIGPLFRQSLWLSSMLSVLMVGLTLGMAEAVAHFGIATELVQPTQAFLHAIAWGAPALCLMFCCRYFVEGSAHTLPTLISGVSGLLLLIPLGYVLMNGSPFNPAYGVAGLGAATAAVLWMTALGYLLYIARAERFAALRPFERFDAPDMVAIIGLLKVSAPMAVALIMEGGLFITTAFLMGGLGTLPAAAHQIAINVASVTFMVPLAIGMATTVRVGMAKGAGDGSALRWAAGAGLAWVLCTQTVAGIALAGFGEPIAALYTRDAQVIAVAAQLLVLAAIFQYADGIQALANGALRGLKDTFWPMWITVLAYWGIGFSAAYVLGFGLDWGAQGLWIGLILGLSAAALGLAARFWRQARRA